MLIIIRKKISEIKEHILPPKARTLDYKNSMARNWVETFENKIIVLLLILLPY